ncbi:MAG: hypothetical protein LBN04_10315 [Oscillospiraceae bacterium]|jgi:hypothetical protein|nr:hypothetical protein [Oscillospiraceae bacterium]
MKKIITMGLIILFLLSASSMAETTPRHIEQTLACAKSFFGISFTLHLQADVTEPAPNTPLPIYQTEAAQVAPGQWNAAVGQADAGYYPNEASFHVWFQEWEVAESYGSAQVDGQAEGLATTPAEAKAQAQVLAERLMSAMGWEGFTRSTCYTMPIDRMGISLGITAYPTGFYAVEYNKMIGGLPVAIDQPPRLASTIDMQWHASGDNLLIFLDDAGIFRAKGHWRTYTEIGQEPLAISLDEAITILQEHMAEAYFFPMEPDCVIDEISLCHRLVQTLPLTDPNSLAQTVTRPAWRFASKVNRLMTGEFVMFVDAVTGEVLW